MYYAIDEGLARRAQEMNSFHDYEAGSETQRYHDEVDAATALAEAKKKKVSVYHHGKIDSLLDSFCRRLAAWINDHNRNRASCPSVMICGPANFPTARKNKQNAREDSLFEEYKDIENILEKIKAVGSGPVDLADPHAREILQEQLESAQKAHENAKKINAYFRKNGTVIGCPVMSEACAKKMQADFEQINQSYSLHDAPYPSYVLSSMRDKVKRIQSRIDQLDKLQAIPEDDQTVDFDGGQIVRNVEQDRLQIMFDEKPDEDLRAKLKAHGFRWSPRNSAWQRQLTENAVTAAKQVLGL